ncbi:uncharacterized protein LOC119989403 [Tripterygium wilfordii]|uniref:uncharacterized protein LOC119989403 n=1 Tax=Tripterygium wilfordii TaxID=458696 RepID=UPI0018F81B0C|nr:uncharacterized protein LOC119989403 [Tripterygium wilfordii]
MEVLQLISLDQVHPHDLIFCEKQVIHLNGREEIFCCACSESLWDTSFYYCSECYFFLHTTCSELPPMIKHPWHHQHPLILHPNSPYGPTRSICDMCDLQITNFLYNCSDCQFDIDIDCAMVARCFIQPERHEHHFTKWSRSDPFTCDFCGTYSDWSEYFRERDCFPRICTNCHVVVHSKCMSLPFTVHLPQHDHPLIHIYFIPGSQSVALICEICRREVNRKFGCYSCQNCPCFVHVNCAMDNVQKVGQEFFWGEGIEGAEDQLLEQEIEHFCHPHHKLFLILHPDNDREIETKCDGCMNLISFPFYKCLECDFSLHVNCSKLPKQINHPLHKQHPLTLILSNNKFAFRCLACRKWCHGFCYYCRTCRTRSSIIDVRCALVNPFEFYHDSHKHLLSVFTEANNYSKCTSCGKEDDCYLLRCKEQCPFALDYGCATLPRTVKYEYDDHYLVLSYQGDGNSNLHDDSNGYPYCDICQKDRDPDLWFYGCPNYLECPNYIHPDCVHGDYPYLKLGTSIKDPYLHEHELFFIVRDKDFLPCFLCSKNDQKISVECYQEYCNLSVHLDCYYEDDDDCHYDDDGDHDDDDHDDDCAFLENGYS